MDKVVCVPVGDSYFKQNLVSCYHRIKMLQIVFRDNQDVVISDYENKHRVVYTYQTLDYFHKLYPRDEIYFICGSDNIREITTWKNYEYILGNYKVLTISRNGYSLETKNSASIIETSVMPNDISSTEIRKNLSSKGIDSDVRKYIYENGLYISN